MPTDDTDAGDENATDGDHEAPPDEAVDIPVDDGPIASPKSIPDESAADLEDAFDAEIRGELPPTVDRAAVRRMAAVAALLDESVELPGTDYRIGIDPLLGVVPGAGDAVAAGVSLYIVLESARLGVSYGTLLAMLANVSVDAVGGSVPVLGALFDAVWKANKWNVELAVEALAGATER